MRDRSNRRRVPPRVEGFKVCNICENSKHVSLFSIHYWAPDGLRYTCRKCRWSELKKRQQAWVIGQPKHTNLPKPEEIIPEIMARTSCAIWEYWF